MSVNELISRLQTIVEHGNGDLPVYYDYDGAWCSVEEIAHDRISLDGPFTPKTVIAVLLK